MDWPACNRLVEQIRRDAPLPFALVGLDLGDVDDSRDRRLYCCEVPFHGIGRAWRRQLPLDALAAPLWTGPALHAVG